MSKSKVSGFKELNRAFQMLGGDLNASGERIVTLAANKAMGVAKENTPVGNYSGDVNFTTSDGKKVSFVAEKRVGGNLKRSWHMDGVKKKKREISRKFYNNANYAGFVNDGHRIVNKKGETIGLTVPQRFLEKGVEAGEQALEKLFEIEVGRIKKKHGF